MLNVAFGLSVVFSRKDTTVFSQAACGGLSQLSVSFRSDVPQRPNITISSHSFSQPLNRPVISLRGIAFSRVSDYTYSHQ